MEPGKQYHQKPKNSRINPGQGTQVEPKITLIDAGNHTRIKPPANMLQEDLTRLEGRHWVGALPAAISEYDTQT